MLHCRISPGVLTDTPRRTSLQQQKAAPSRILPVHERCSEGPVLHIERRKRSIVAMPTAGHNINDLAEPKTPGKTYEVLAGFWLRRVVKF